MFSLPEEERERVKKHKKIVIKRKPAAALQRRLPQSGMIATHDLSLLRRSNHAFAIICPTGVAARAGGRR